MRQRDVTSVPKFIWQIKLETSFSPTKGVDNEVLTDFRLTAFILSVQLKELITPLTIYDKLSRPLKDLRISVIDRCNFRCTYCMPKEIFGKDYPFIPPEQLLTFAEITRLAHIFIQLGVRKIRLTGGEPLLRKNIDQLIEKIIQLNPKIDISLTTNGALLSKLAPKLFRSGLKRVNVSLDALDEEISKSINHTNISPQEVIHGIRAARDAGLKVKVNMVVMKGVNDGEIIPMATFFRKENIPLRFIEFMDVGQTNGWNWNKVVTKKEIFQKLSKHFILVPIDSAYFGEVAKRYLYKNTQTEVGFITSVSESFCSSCTRARIAADGKLYTCLFAERGFDLRRMLRSGKSDEEIKNTIISIWNNRSDRYSDERNERSQQTKRKIEMSYIGG
jgi:GTP 3',8-cyclase